MECGPKGVFVTSKGVGRCGDIAMIWWYTWQKGWQEEVGVFSIFLKEAFVLLGLRNPGFLY